MNINLSAFSRSKHLCLSRSNRCFSRSTFNISFSKSSEFLAFFELYVDESLFAWGWDLVDCRFKLESLNDGKLFFDLILFHSSNFFWNSSGKSFSSGNGFSPWPSNLNWPVFHRCQSIFLFSGISFEVPAGEGGGSRCDVVDCCF